MTKSNASQTHAWHRLFGPLPDDVVPRRNPVASPDVLKLPQAEALAGWQQLTIELSAGREGLRVAMVVLDAAGQPISASDMVMHRIERDNDEVEYVHDNVGGRIEADGRFLGTRWHSVSVESKDGEVLRAAATPRLQQAYAVGR